MMFVSTTRWPGIAEVRDESDREGLRIAIELKKDADSQTILNYLLKYTDLAGQLQLQHGGY